ncbi:MAG TPA: hypothetical protein V6D25_03960 [Leptolyngbyaceae cyanobacterium]
MATYTKYTYPHNVATLPSPHATKTHRDHKISSTDALVQLLGYPGILLSPLNPVML